MSLTFDITKPGGPFRNRCERANRINTKREKIYIYIHDKTVVVLNVIPTVHIYCTTEFTFLDACCYCDVALKTI